MKLHLKSTKGYLAVVKRCDKLRLVRLYENNKEQLKSVSGHDSLYIDKVLKMI